MLTAGYKLYEIWGLHGGEIVDCGLLVCDTVLLTVLQMAANVSGYCITTSSL
jgi:hypothetical protein